LLYLFLFKTGKLKKDRKRVYMAESSDSDDGLYAAVRSDNLKLTSK